MTPTQVIAKLAVMGLPPEKMEEAASLLEAMWTEAKAPEEARKARQRDRQKRYRDGDERDSDATERDTDQHGVADVSRETQKESSPIPPKEKTISPKLSTCAREEADEAVEAWNVLAADLGLARVQRLTDERRTKLKARLRDCGGLDGWLVAMGKIRGSPFLRGDNSNGWRADFDFVLQAKSFTKLMEGGYDDRSHASKPRTGLSAAFEAIDQRIGAGGQGTGHG